MSKDITIVGAGMAGLLAGQMLRRYSPRIVERQPVLPSNHSALLRFRSPSIANATGIPFSKVLVRKGIWTGFGTTDRCDIPLANNYSKRVTGGYSDRSIWNLEPEERWVAPKDFVQQLAVGLNIEYNAPFSRIDHNGGTESRVVISTLPMPLMAKMFGYPFSQAFESNEIYTAKAWIESPACNVFQTIYNGSPVENGKEWYRATVHGNEVTVEGMSPFVPEGLADLLLSAFGIRAEAFKSLTLGRQPFGKLVPQDNEERKRFILWLTENHKIYSLGRFATWRKILLDDVMQDIKVIQNFIEEGHSYNRQLANAR